MGFKSQLAARVIGFVGFLLIAVVGLLYWAISYQTGDIAGQVTGIMTCGFFGILWIATVWVHKTANSRTPLVRRHRY